MSQAAGQPREPGSRSGRDQGHAKTQSGAAVVDFSRATYRRITKARRVVPAPAPICPLWSRRIQERVGAPAQSARKAVAAPLPDVAVHVVQAPSVCRVT